MPTNSIRRKVNQTMLILHLPDCLKKHLIYLPLSLSELEQQQQLVLKSKFSNQFIRRIIQNKLKTT